MGLHKDLTGTDLHEPKGVSAAASGAVYIANGTGSGAWTSKNADVFNANLFPISAQMSDIGTVTSAWFYVPLKSELVSFTSQILAALTGANAILSVYINGVLFADTLTVPFTGSTAGQTNTKTVVTANTVPAGASVEVRSDGGPTNAVASQITLYLRSKA